MTIVLVILGIGILFLLYGYLSNWLLAVNEYKIHVTNLPDELDGLRIVHLSDLHGCHFGKNNAKLRQSIQETKPDLILMSGDMIVKDGKGRDKLLALCAELVLICPVYYSLGNHETRYEEWPEVEAMLKAGQVTVLDNETAAYEKASQTIQIKGLTLDEKCYDKVWKKPKVKDGTLEKLLGKKENVPTILLAHNPEYFQQYVNWGADVVLAGHYHGGIMRLPFRGALAPNLRIFPKYSYGTFEEKDTTMLVSRGLGTHHIKLRFFNNPEVCVVTLKKRT